MSLKKITPNIKTEPSLIRYLQLLAKSYRKGPDPIYSGDESPLSLQEQNEFKNYTDDPNLNFDPENVEDWFNKLYYVMHPKLWFE